MCMYMRKKVLSWKLIEQNHPNIFCFSRPSDRVRKKMKNYAGIFRHIMQKNMLITQKTCWIMQKFKQFITLIIVSFHSFFCHLNYLVRFILLLRLSKFILNISLNHKMNFWDDELAKEDNMFKFPRASTSQMQFLINYCYSLKCQLTIGSCFSVRASSCGGTWEVWRAREKCKSAPRATLASWVLSRLPECIHGSVYAQLRAWANCFIT